MDEMTTQVSGLVSVMLVLLALSAAALACFAAWLGQRQARRGSLARVIAVTNLLVLVTLCSAAAAFAGRMDVVASVWPWVFAFGAAPLLGGYALGTSLGLLRR